MKLIEFTNRFPSEKSCKQSWKEYRIKRGVVCPHCGCTSHYWKQDKECFECKECGYRQSLRANTVRHGSQLPFQYWFIAIHLLSSMKKGISALELQHQLGHKNYNPIWAMSHKLRLAMGKRDEQYKLSGVVELDEGFFTTETPDSEKDKPKKRGRGSQNKSKVLVMAETADSKAPRHSLDIPPIFPRYSPDRTERFLKSSYPNAILSIFNFQFSPFTFPIPLRFRMHIEPLPNDNRNITV